MKLNIFLQSASDVVSILSIQNVSVVGILLLIIIYLVWNQNKTDKKNDLEKDNLNKKISEAHNKLESEYQKSNEDIKSIIEKYYKISTKILETLKYKL